MIAKRLRATLTALLVMFAAAGAAVAGPLEDSFVSGQRGDFATALRLVRPLAEQGNAIAQTDLGIMYLSGQGVPQNYAEAVEWIRRAAEQGNAWAQFFFATMYANGYGVRDEAEAAKWYQRAAEQGNAFAQRDLGACYALGRGVSKNYILAHMWYNLAAASRFEPYFGLPMEEDLRDFPKMSSKDRDRLASEMTSAQIVEAQKLARDWKPKLER
jgi:TPR repeat protein